MILILGIDFVRYLGNKSVVAFEVSESH